MLSKSRVDSNLSFIMTNKFLTAQYGKTFIEDIRKRGKFELLIDFMDSPIFDDAKTYPCIIIVSRKSLNEIGYVLPEVRIIRENNPRTIQQRLINTDDASDVDSLRQGFIMCRVGSVTLGEMCEWIREGSANGKDAVFILNESSVAKLNLERDVIKTFFYSSDFGRYWTNTQPQAITLWPYDSNNKLIKATRYPGFNSYINNHRSQLEDRYCVRKGGKEYYSYHDPAFPSVTNEPKIVTGDVALYPSFAIVEDEAVFKNTCYVLIPNPGICYPTKRGRSIKGKKGGS